jgi:hypothetical protein
MHTGDRHEVLSQIRYEELRSDATIAWDQTFDQCYRVAFDSPTLEAAGHYMADVTLQYIQEDGTPVTSPHSFNVASFWLDGASTPPDPKGC